MATLRDPVLTFDGGCPDCGERRVVLPIPLPGVTNDFDWTARDYDSFRLFMMQELSYRFPGRQRWTPADMEVVIVELLAAALDRASHALDAVQAERYLETARRPQSVRRLLKLIGYDATLRTDPTALADLPPAPGNKPETDDQRLERYWQLNPLAMEEARKAGPRLTGEVRRMVTLEDHRALLEQHPLVARARARLVWTGAWSTILVAVLLDSDRSLDTPLADGTGSASDAQEKALWAAILHFHRTERLPFPSPTGGVTPRALLRIVIEQNRMLGSEVLLEAAKPVPITFALSVRVKKGYFRSEIKQALRQVFTSDQGGFFEPGRLGFGVDLFASDIIEAAMAIEGVEVACLNRFKRVGTYPDKTYAGVIEIAEDEFALCRNDQANPSDGTYRISVNAGEST